MNCLYAIANGFSIEMIVKFCREKRKKWDETAWEAENKREKGKGRAG